MGGEPSQARRRTGKGHAGGRASLVKEPRPEPGGTPPVSSSKSLMPAVNGNDPMFYSARWYALARATRGLAMQILVSLLIILLAVFVLRRLLGIERGRWMATLIAVVVGLTAATVLAREVYGHASKVPIGAVFAAWAVVTVFAMLTLVLIELLSSRLARRPRRGIPHPIRGARRMIRRGARYVEVGRIVVRSGLLHASSRRTDVAATQVGRSLRSAIEQAGGLFVKLGQAMAEQPQLVTQPVAAELAKLHDEAAPADPEAAHAVIAEDLGPPNEVFTEISAVPIGAASIAQTYPARLPDGRDVVVKVQRPGVGESIENDLDILRRLADRLDRRTTWARPLGLKEMMAGFDEGTRQELDFRIEAANQTAARKTLPETTPVRIPDVIEGYTTARVLVEERAQGQTIRASGVFEGWDANRRRGLADSLLSLTMRQMVSGEPFHADPHPGNVFLRPDGRLELIDFGAVGRLDPYARSALVDILQGLQADDPALLREGLLRVGTTTRKVDEEALDRELSRLLSQGVHPDGTMNAQLFEDLLFLVRDFGILLPRSTTTLFRTLVTLLGTLEVISPGYQVIDAAQRLGEEVIAEQAIPHTVSELMMKTAMTNAPILQRLPQQLGALARSLLHGELRTRVSLLSEPEDVRAARGMLNRLVMGIVASALALTSSIMVSAGSAPALGGVRVVNILGGIGLFFSVLLLLRLVVQILRDRE